MGIRWLHVFVGSLVLVVACGVLYYFHSPQRHHPAFTFARDAALDIRDALEREGYSNPLPSSLAELRVSSRARRSQFTNSPYYGSQCWSWKGYLTPAGRFVGVIVADGSKEDHGRTYSFTFDERENSQNYEVGYGGEAR